MSVCLAFCWNVVKPKVGKWPFCCTFVCVERKPLWHLSFSLGLRIQWKRERGKKLFFSPLMQCGEEPRGWKWVRNQVKWLVAQKRARGSMPLFRRGGRNKTAYYWATGLLKLLLPSGVPQEMLSQWACQVSSNGNPGWHLHWWAWKIKSFAAYKRGFGKSPKRMKRLRCAPSAVVVADKMNGSCWVKSQSISCPTPTGDDWPTENQGKKG